MNIESDNLKDYSMRLYEYQEHHKYWTWKLRLEYITKGKTSKYRFYRARMNYFKYRIEPYFN